MLEELAVMTERNLSTVSPHQKSSSLTTPGTRSDQAACAAPSKNAAAGKGGEAERASGP